MKNKKWLIVLIVAFPSLFWLILESSTINSKKLPHYGPKVVNAPADTSFYEVPDAFIKDNDSLPSILTKKDFPLYAIMFISDKYRADAYRLTGLWEYLNYKEDKIKHIPFVLVLPSDSGKNKIKTELQKISEHANVSFRTWPAANYEQLVKTYFKDKPYYIDYSFFMLIDAQRNIRGYYDARYVSEIKRLIEEYQHLRIKEEKLQMIKQNEIKNNS